MEDDSGIELTLGLSCGGSAGKSKAKDDNLDHKTDEGGSPKLIDGTLNVPSVKHFLQSGIDNADAILPQRSNQGIQLHENFWTALGKCPEPNPDASAALHGNSSQWVTNNSYLRGADQLPEMNEEKLDQHEFSGKLWLEVGNKRKLPFEEIKHQKKQEKEGERVDNHDKGSMGVPAVRSSPVSATTEDASSAENDDVAESEAEGSTSRLGPPLEDGAKQFMGSGLDAPRRKNKQGFPDLGFTDADGPSLKQPNITGNKANLESGNMAYESSLLLQPLTAMTMPYPLPVKAPSSMASGSGSGFPLPCIMQLMPPSGSERPAIRSMNPNAPLAFGYSAVQLPTLEIDSSWGIASQPQQFPVYGSRSAEGVANGERVEDDLRMSQAAVPTPHNLSEALPYEGKAVETAKSDTKQQASVTAGFCSSSQADDEAKGSNINFRQREIADQQPALEGFPHEGLGIRPGVGPGLKFGGSGLCPDLPWVSTTGPGPSGKTISGVTYRHSRNQIRIVCACHGSHMSPDEFVQHASADGPNQENNAGLASFLNSNSAGPAQS